MPHERDQARKPRPRLGLAGTKAPSRGGSPKFSRAQRAPVRLSPEATPDVHEGRSSLAAEGRIRCAPSTALMSVVAL